MQDLGSDCSILCSYFKIHRFLDFSGKKGLLCAPSLTPCIMYATFVQSFNLFSWANWYLLYVAWYKGVASEKVETHKYYIRPPGALELASECWLLKTKRSLKDREIKWCDYCKKQMNGSMIGKVISGSLFLVQVLCFFPSANKSFFSQHNLYFRNREMRREKGFFRRAHYIWTTR